MIMLCRLLPITKQYQQFQKVFHPQAFYRNCPYLKFNNKAANVNYNSEEPKVLYILFEF